MWLYKKFEISWEIDMNFIQIIFKKHSYWTLWIGRGLGIAGHSLPDAKDDTICCPTFTDLFNEPWQIKLPFFEVHLIQTFNNYMSI